MTEKREGTSSFASTVPFSSLAPFPHEGIKLSYLVHDFLEDECGGKSSVQSLTTEQVCEKYIKPKTKLLQSSYCELLKSKNHQAYGAYAQVFVSHAHKCNFWNLVTALQYKLSKDGGDDIIIWLDIFSINQHATTNWTFDWLCETFKSSIQRFGYTIMVMSPWNNPVPFTRAWCILEAYWTLETSSKFEISMGEDDRKQFLLDVGNDTESIKHLPSTIQAEQSQCSLREDRERIFAVIQASGGFPKLNALVLEQYREWVIQVATQALDECRCDNPDSGDAQLKRLHLLRVTGNLYKGQGKFLEAENLLLESFVGRKTRLGEDDPATLDSMYDMALLYHSQGYADKAIAMLRDCWEKRKRVLGETDNDTLDTMSALASYMNHDVTEAIPLLKECLDLRTSTSGPDHPATLTVMNRLAFHYNRQNQHEKSRRLLEDCLQKRRSVLGPGHPDCLSTMVNLAVAYDRLGMFAKSLPLYEECLEKRRLALGENNPETLSAMNTLGVHFKNLRVFDKARPLLEECLERRKVVLGPNHRATLLTMWTLSKLYQMLGAEEKACSLLSDWVEKGGLTAVRNTTAHYIAKRLVWRLLKKYRAQGLVEKAEAVKQMLEEDGRATEEFGKQNKTDETI